LQSSLQAANLSSDNRSYKISAYNLPETNILVLSVTGPDAGITQLLTYEISHLGQEMITEIYPMYTITTLEDPNFPSTPIGSGSQRNLVMATFLGAGLGLAVAVLIYGDLGAILGFSR
jgi:capsular polysaccharide biosynthesis protein